MGTAVTIRHSFFFRHVRELGKVITRFPVWVVGVWSTNWTQQVSNLHPGVFNTTQPALRRESFLIYGTLIGITVMGMTGGPTDEAFTGPKCYRQPGFVNIDVFSGSHDYFQSRSPCIMHQLLCKWHDRVAVVTMHEE